MLLVTRREAGVRRPSLRSAFDEKRTRPVGRDRVALPFEFIERLQAHDPGFLELAIRAQGLGE